MGHTRPLVGVVFGVLLLILGLFTLVRQPASAHGHVEPAAPLAPLELDFRVGMPQASLFREIEPTRAISIPYRFTTPLLLNVGAQTVVVTGPGSCTAGQSLTVEVTVEQAAIGASAAGLTQTICTGEDGGWGVLARSAPGPALGLGPARACGVATTRSGETVTDTMDWCRDVMLRLGVFLPVLSAR